MDVRFRGQSGHCNFSAACPLLMLWTAPTLRHQSAKGGCVKRTTLRGAVHGRG